MLNDNTRIPKSFKDCIGGNYISENLWVWSKRLEKIGITLLFIIIIGGIITAFTSATELSGEVTRFSKSTFSWDLFLIGLLDTALYAILEYAVYHILSLLVGALASIVESTKTTAALAMFNSRDYTPDQYQNYKTDFKIKTPTAESHKRKSSCDKCGTELPNLPLCKIIEDDKPRFYRLCPKCKEQYQGEKIENK